MQPHKGSQETFDYIADWITPDFFFSKKDLWDRMGMLGVFADYAMNSVSGAILEIGCGESSIYLSHVAKKYNRRIYHCDVAAGKIENPLTVPGYFALQEPQAVLFIGSSDDLFKNVCPEPLALSFIDGDHHYEQAKKDFENCLAITVDHGFILLHDTHPPTEAYCCPDSACGDVYKLRQDIEKDPRVDCITLSRATAMGVGLTICRKRLANAPYYQGQAQ